jgi:hypothetical protein
MHESSRIEYKRELTDNLERVVVSFLNAREGGAILLGVDNNGEIIGIGDTGSTQLKIKDRLKNNILLLSLYQAMDDQWPEGVKPENEGVKPENDGVKQENDGVKPENEGVKPGNEG